MIKFPNKCIKCKKEDLPLNDFIYTRILFVRKFKSIYFKIPVCDKCKKELAKYERILRYLKLKNSFFCIFCISTFFIYTWTSYNQNVSPALIIFTIFISILSGSLTVLLLILHIIFYLKKYDRISNYVEVNTDGSIFIKDPEYRKEFEQLSLVNEDEKENELYNCPNCNTLVLIDMEFCHVCGEDLRKIPKI
jgi:hypothetical protein